MREGPEVLAKMDMRFGSEGRGRNVDEFSISSLLSQFREFLQLEFGSSPGLVAYTTLSHGLRSRSEIGLTRYSRTSKPEISESFPHEVCLAESLVRRYQGTRCYLLFVG